MLESRCHRRSRKRGLLRWFHCDSATCLIDRQVVPRNERHPNSRSTNVCSKRPSVKCILQFCLRRPTTIGSLCHEVLFSSALLSSDSSSDVLSQMKKGPISRCRIIAWHLSSSVKIPLHSVLGFTLGRLRVVDQYSRWLPQLMLYPAVPLLWLQRHWLSLD